MADTLDDLNELERVLRGTIRELREHPDIIPQYVTLVEREIREKARLLAAIPECPVHGQDCVPHALDWINEQKQQQRSKEATAMTQNGQNNGNDGWEVVQGYSRTTGELVPMRVQARGTGFTTAPTIDVPRIIRQRQRRTFLRLALGHGAECVKNGGLFLSDVYWLARSLVRGR